MRDVLRPSAVVRFRAGLDEQGMPVAFEAISATEGPTEGIANKQGDKIDPTAVEGLAGKKIRHCPSSDRSTVLADPGDAGLLAFSRELHQ